MMKLKKETVLSYPPHSFHICQIFFFNISSLIKKKCSETLQNYFIIKGNFYHFLKVRWSLIYKLSVPIQFDSDLLTSPLYLWGELFSWIFWRTFLAALYINWSVITYLQESWKQVIIKIHNMCVSQRISKITTITCIIISQFIITRLQTWSFAAQHLAEPKRTKKNSNSKS